MMKKDSLSDTSSLRQKAEELLMKKPLNKSDQLADTDVLKIIHELEVRMIEVEMQNDELLIGAASSAIDTEKFRKLYEFSPSGYFTLSSNGKILQLNQKGAVILGKEQGKLVNSMFGFFVSDDTRPIFNSFLKKVFISNQTETCEVVITKEDKPADQLYIKGKAQDDISCMITTTITTEIKLLEKVLVSREERLQLAIKAIGFGTYSFDFVSGISIYSKEFLSIYGLNPNDRIELDSDLVPKAIHPEDKNYFLRSMNYANDPTGNGILNIVFRIFHTDGTVRWLRTNGLTVFSGIEKSDRPLYANGIIQDITAQKKAEYELKRSEERFKLFFDSSPDGIVRIGNSGLIESANLAQSRMYGCESPEEMVGISPTLLIAPSMREYSAGIMKRRLNGEDIPPVEYDLIRMDGTIFKGETSATILRNEDDSVSGYICVTRDTTLRLIERQALQNSEKKFRSLFEAMHEGFAFHEIICDKAGKAVDYRFLEINPAFENLTGLKAKEIIGRTYLEVFPDDEKFWVDTYGEVALTGNQVHFENFNKVLDRYYQVSAYSPEQGKFATIFLDITKRKIGEIELEKSHSTLFKLSQQVPGVIYQYRLYPDGRSCFPYSSSGMYEIYEYYPKDVCEDATPVFGRLHPEDSEMVSALITESARNLTHFHCEFRVILPSQGLRWRYSDAMPEKMTDGSTLWHGIIYDITESKTKEIELENSREQLEQLNLYLHRVREEERKHISRELHDELGQALTAIKIDIGILKNNLTTSINLVPKIDKITSLLNDSIITVQRLTSELRPHILDDLGLVAAIDWYTKEYIERTGIPIAINIDKSISLPAEIELVIFRILQESLTNIARHSKADNAEIIFYRQKSDVILEIKDDGIGISTVDRKSPKSLGLLNMSERARDIGGKFVIESRKKKGARICLTVPDILFEE